MGVSFWCFSGNKCLWSLFLCKSAAPHSKCHKLPHPLHILRRWWSHFLPASSLAEPTTSTWNSWATGFSFIAETENNYDGDGLIMTEYRQVYIVAQTHKKVSAPWRQNWDGKIRFDQSRQSPFAFLLLFFLRRSLFNADQRVHRLMVVRTEHFCGFYFKTTTRLMRWNPEGNNYNHLHHHRQRRGSGWM